MTRMTNLVSIVDRVVAVEIVAVLGEHLWEHNVPLVPRSRIRSRLNDSRI